MNFQPTFRKIKYLFNVVNGATPQSSVLEYWDGDIPWVTPEDIANEPNPSIFRTKRSITKEGYASCGTTLVPKNSIILTTRAPIGNIGISEVELCSNQGCKILIPKNEIFPKYAYYSVLSRKENLVSLGQGSTFRELSSDSLKNVSIPLPPLPLQKAIAAYLDKETTRIDTLIAKKERQIELLQEKRQAIITQAITKGLDPKAKMKDSGVEWIGEIPEGWSVKKLRYIGTCQNGISKGGEYFGSGSPFVSYGDVYKNYELPKTVEGLVESSEQEKNACSVEEGDTLFTRTSETIEEIGFASTCMSTIKDAVFAGFLIRFRPKKNLLYKLYSKYYFRSDILRRFFIKEMSIVTRASLSQDLLKSLPVLLPSFEEMKKIGTYLETKNKEIDSLIQKIETTKVILHEYRSSLITATVSGQIDISSEQEQPHLWGGT